MNESYGNRLFDCIHNNENKKIALFQYNSNKLINFCRKNKRIKTN